MNSQFAFLARCILNSGEKCRKELWQKNVPSYISLLDPDYVAPRLLRHTKSCSCKAINCKVHYSKQLQLTLIVITLEYESEFNRQHGCIFIDFTFLPLSIITYFSWGQFLIKKSISCTFKEITGEVKIQNIYLSKCFNITLLTANNAMNNHVIHFIDKGRLPLCRSVIDHQITKYNSPNRKCTTTQDQ